jgi:hypothetical protein
MLAAQEARKRQDSGTERNSSGQEQVDIKLLSGY